MSVNQQLALAMGGLIVFAAAYAQSTHTAYASQNAVSVSIQITDSKLWPINMGLDSAQHWLTKMEAGDVQR